MMNVNSAPASPTVPPRSPSPTPRFNEGFSLGHQRNADDWTKRSGKIRPELSEQSTSAKGKRWAVRNPTSGLDLLDDETLNSSNQSNQPNQQSPQIGTNSTSQPSPPLSHPIPARPDKSLPSLPVNQTTSTSTSTSTTSTSTSNQVTALPPRDTAISLANARQQTHRSAELERPKSPLPPTPKKQPPPLPPQPKKKLPPLPPTPPPLPPMRQTSRSSLFLGSNKTDTSQSINNALIPGEQICKVMSDVFLIGFAPETYALVGILGTIYITSFQLIFVGPTSRVMIPLAAIDKVKPMLPTELNKNKKKTSIIHQRIQNHGGFGNWGFTVICKYPYEAHFVSKERTHITAFQTILEQFMYITRVEQSFSVSHRAEVERLTGVPASDGWDVYKIREDYTRLGMHTGDWRIMENERYSLCDTYPSVLVFPSCMTRMEIYAVANFRSKRRLPAIVWKKPNTNVSICRCSQPRRGLMGNRCKEDEKLFETLRVLAGDIILLDCRPMVNAYANRLKGAGVENMEHYQMQREFLDIENIHAMRNSLEKLSKSVIQMRMGEIPQDKIDNASWMEHLEFVLLGTLRVVHCVEAGRAVVVHCSDGWDRTSQVCALAEILLDPHYRTILGFEFLIEKEWLAFGHMFQKRIGFGSKEERAKQRSQTAPIFAQFIDCVWQIWKQYPSAFEYNEKFLKEILFHLYSERFGTFLLNSELQREMHEIKNKTISLWSYINNNKSYYTNPNYTPLNDTIHPMCNRYSLTFWTDYYLGFV